MTRAIYWRNLTNLQPGDVLASSAPLGSYSTPSARHEAYLIERSARGIVATVTKAEQLRPWSFVLTCQTPHGTTLRTEYRQDVVFPIVVDASRIVDNVLTDAVPTDQTVTNAPPTGQEA